MPISTNNPDSLQVEVTIIGAGILGCAIAHQFAMGGLTPLVLEKGNRIAEGITSRNSGVIHAGIYYPPASLKAQSCIRGSHLLYEWCQEKGVPFRKTGKWIIGKKENASRLQELFLNATEAGAEGLSLGTTKQISHLSAHLYAEIGMYSSQTGIVDPYELSRSLQASAEEKGTDFLLNCEVIGIDRIPGRNFLIHTTRGEIESEKVVNASGLSADSIASLVGVDKYQIYPWRGDYFKLKKATSITQLIYPIKERNSPGLGIHLTLGIDGSQKLGPDVKYVENRTDFSPPQEIEALKIQFFESCRSYFKGITLENLEYDTCGIRPKLRAPYESDEKDFIISKDFPGFINLLGIESPGLTASLDIAQRVVNLL